MARTAKTASNNTELSNALTQAEKDRTALVEANAKIAALEAKLDAARALYVEMRDIIRAQRPVTKPVSEAKAAYNARATAGRIAFAKSVEARAKNAKAFFAAHPDVKSATDSEIAEWVEAQGEATV
jgi:hypothetical protein